MYGTSGLVRKTVYSKMKDKETQIMSDFSADLKPFYDGPAQLRYERQSSDVATEELSRHLLSRGDFLDRQLRVLEVLQNDPLFDKSQQMNLARPVRQKPFTPWRHSLSSPRIDII
jgi:hypothetical protein